MKTMKNLWWLGALAGASILLLAAGCGTLDRAYKKQVTWTNAPVVQVMTNTIVATNVVLVTNEATGAVSGYATREAVATNFVTVVLTNLVPVFYTNLGSRTRRREGAKGRALRLKPFRLFFVASRLRVFA